MTEHDQLNLFGKQVQLAAGTDQLEYHSDGQACRYYSAKDMQLITSRNPHVDGIAVGRVIRYELHGRGCDELHILCTVISTCLSV